MQKLLFIFLSISILFFLCCTSILAQSDNQRKLTRAEKAESYPTTFGNRYFVTPSAIPLEKGQFSLHSTELRVLSGSYGITKNISVNGGFNLGTLFNSYEEVLPHLTTKVGFEIAPKLYVGGGVFALVDSYDGLDLLGLGMITLGDRNANITWTYIYDFNKGGISGNNEFQVVSPISLSGMYRVNKYVAFVSENHIPNSNNRGLYHFAGFEGIRLIFKKNAIDLGVIVLADKDSFSLNGERVDSIYYQWYPFLGYTFAF